MPSNPNKTEAHKDMLSESCWVLKTMLVQRPLPAGCLGHAGTLWTHLECFLATWDMSVWALMIQSEPYCPWDLCWQRTDRSKPHGCRMLRKEKLSTQEAVFHLAVTRSILKGSTRQCSQHGGKQYSILCTEFWGKASLPSLPTVAFLWCLDTCWMLRNSVKLLKWEFTSSLSAH